MMHSGQSANLREDFTYTVRDQQSFLTRYSNLAATVTVGTTSMGYDAVGRLTNLQHKDGSAVNIANYTHTYDAASRVTTEKLNAGATTTYQYDNTDQLTNDAVVTYSYDANGNRTMSGYTTGPNNQLMSDGAWNYYADKNGNITQKIKPSTGEIWNFGYDNRNRLTTVTDTTSAGLQMQGTYTHDALGQRVQKSVWTSSGGTTTTTRFAYDNRQIIADLDGSSALTMRYLFGSRILERLARVSNAGTVAWLLLDRLGSTRNVVNSGGSTIDTAAFDGFGNIVSQSSAANGGAYLWAGYRLDSETGLLIPDPTWGRVYGPPVGRWWSVDPIWADANLWRYVLNDATNLTDPSGLQYSLIAPSVQPLRGPSQPGPFYQRPSGFPVGQNIQGGFGQGAPGRHSLPPSFAPAFPAGPAMPLGQGPGNWGPRLQPCRPSLPPANRPAPSEVLLQINNENADPCAPFLKLLQIAMRIDAIDKGLKNIENVLMVGTIGTNVIVSPVKGEAIKQINKELKEQAVKELQQAIAKAMLGKVVLDIAKELAKQPFNGLSACTALAACETNEKGNTVGRITQQNALGKEIIKCQWKDGNVTYKIKGWGHEIGIMEWEG